MIATALKWIGDTDGVLELIDQRRLPAEFVKLQCGDIEEINEFIKTLAA
jgi:methylthioribose-1-phosphate isomerase